MKKSNKDLALIAIIVIVIILSGYIIYSYIENTYIEENANNESFPWDNPPNWRTYYVPTMKKENWIITANETYSDEVIEVAGNITIENGADVTLYNSTIVMNGSWIVSRYEYSNDFLSSTIHVNGSISLLNNSRVTSKNRTITYLTYMGKGGRYVVQYISYIFVFYRDSYGDLEESVIEGGLLIIESNNVQMVNCTVRGGNGIIIDRSSPLIFDNVIEYNSHGISISHNSAPTIKSNLIRYNGYDGISVSFCKERYPTIENNNITWNKRNGIYVWPNEGSPIAFFLISNNTISYNLRGIYCREGGSPRILNNTISNNRGDGIRCWYYSCPDIIGNTIINNEGTAIEYDGTCDPYVKDNYIYGNKELN